MTGCVALFFDPSLSSDSDRSFGGWWEKAAELKIRQLSGCFSSHGYSGGDLAAQHSDPVAFSAVLK